MEMRAACVAEPARFHVLGPGSPSLPTPSLFCLASICGLPPPPGAGAAAAPTDLSELLADGALARLHAPPITATTRTANRREAERGELFIGGDSTDVRRSRRAKDLGQRTFAVPL
jgi:hypothetical protein